MIYGIMGRTIEELEYNVYKMDECRVRIIISEGDNELGTLYFERGKHSFNRKPISMGSWVCVDAKVEGLYEMGGEEITPMDVIGKCQDLIRKAGY